MLLTLPIKITDETTALKLDSKTLSDSAYKVAMNIAVFRNGASICSILYPA